MSDARPEPGERPVSGERVILKCRPGAMSLVLRPAWSVVMIIVAAMACVWILDRLASRAAGDPTLVRDTRTWSSYVAMAALGLVAIRLVWVFIDWRCRRFVLTDRRIVRAWGVFSRGQAELPLRNVQDVVIHRTLGERVLGLGSIAVVGASGGGVAWVHAADPEDTFAQIRRAIDHASGGATLGAADAASTSTSAPGVPLRVIGLVGGIGSGKSTVAAEIARQAGGIVIDSDKEAKAALDRPDVRDQLIAWWGRGVMGKDGRIDRGQVADIVFRRPEERARLEGLVHPIVRSTRAQAIERARAAGAGVAIIDAPLLFEAGVDRECDLVLYVDAPLEARVGRVKATRGWDAAELERREKAQLPLEEKRQRSDDVVVNDGEPGSLPGRVADLLQRIQGRVSRLSST
ncbi:MAG: dephospho-CoA kinase [Phycisphaerales bacterium]